MWAQISEWMPVDPNAYLSPTETEDCAYERMPSYRPKESAVDALRQCSEGEGSNRFQWIADCGYPSLKRCAPLEGQLCLLRTNVQKEAALCSEKLQEHRADIAEQRRRFDEEQRAAVDLARQHDRRTRQALDMSRDALGRGDFSGANRILDGLIDQQDPTNLPRDLRGTSNALGRMLGIVPRPVDRLSGQLTNLSLNAYRDITERAMAEFGNAMAGGALEIDRGSGDTDDSGTNTGKGDAFPDPGESLIPTDNGFADIMANWDEMSSVGQVASILSVIGTMAMIAEGDGQPIPPSLVDGTFAANVTALAEAAAGGTFKFGDEVDVYAARAEVVSREIVLERTALAMREEQETRKAQAAAIAQAEADAAGAQAAAEILAAEILGEASNGSELVGTPSSVAKELYSCLKVSQGKFPRELKRFIHDGYKGENGLIVENTCKHFLYCEVELTDRNRFRYNSVLQLGPANSSCQITTFWPLLCDVEFLWPIVDIRPQSQRGDGIACREHESAVSQGIDSNNIVGRAPLIAEQIEDVPVIPNVPNCGIEVACE